MAVEPVQGQISCVSDEVGQERGKENGRAVGGAVRQRRTRTMTPLSAGVWTTVTLRDTGNRLGNDKRKGNDSGEESRGKI